MSNFHISQFIASKTNNKIVIDAFNNSILYFGGNPNKNKSNKFIYFLIHNNEIKYVGSTTNLKDRIRDHIRTKPAFSSIQAVAVNGDNACHISIESIIINELQPTWNKVTPRVPKDIIYHSFEKPDIIMGTCGKLIFKPVSEVKPQIRKASLGRGLTALLDEYNKIEKVIINNDIEIIKKLQEELKHFQVVLKLKDDRINLNREVISWMSANPVKEYIFVPSAER